MLGVGMDREREDVSQSIHSFGQSGRIHSDELLYNTVAVVKNVLSISELL
jgi:hypothetical protein